MKFIVSKIHKTLKHQLCFFKSQKVFYIIFWTTFQFQTAYSQEPIHQPNVRVRGLGGQSFVNTKKDSIYLKGLENVIDIEFPTCNDSIYYLLEGFESKEQVAYFAKIRYTNLIGGHYRLKYRFAGEEKKYTIKIYVEQVMWQKWWFIPMVFGYIFLTLSLIAFFFIQNNFRQKLKLQYLRNKISADLHDEVGSNLSSIAIFSEVLKKKIPENNIELKDIIEKIISNSKESVGLMQDTVWTLNPNNDSLEMLFGKIENYARQMLTAKGIAYSQEVNIQSNKWKLDMENRKNLYMILKEGVNNISKHSGAQTAGLEVFEKEGKILFYLFDDGRGFDTEEIPDGNGLRNFRERAKESDFELEIKTSQGNGTSISLVISP